MGAYAIGIVMMLVGMLVIPFRITRSTKVGWLFSGS